MDPTQKNDSKFSKLPPLYPKLPPLNPITSHEPDQAYNYRNEQELNPVLPESHGANLMHLPSLYNQNKPLINEWKPLPSLRYNPPASEDQNSLQPITQNQGYVRIGKQRTWLIWSVISTILFLPFFFLWIPALICSLKSRKKLNDHNIDAKKFANISLFLNITCLIIGVICYLTAIIVASVLLQKSKPSSNSNSNPYMCADNCYDYCRIENSAFFYIDQTYSSYWTCYKNQADYLAYQYDIRYLYCKYIYLDQSSIKKFICQNQKF